MDESGQDDVLCVLTVNMKAANQIFQVIVRELIAKVT
jgi:hypothetical protein